MAWTVDIKKGRAIHSGGLIVKFKKDSVGGWIGLPEGVVPAKYERDAQSIARLMREAGDCFSGALCAGELRKIMQRHKLTRQAVADKLGVALSTVDSWLAPPDAARARNMPLAMLKLLRFELAEKRHD